MSDPRRTLPLPPPGRYVGEALHLATEGPRSRKLPGPPKTPSMAASEGGVKRSKPPAAPRRKERESVRDVSPDTELPSWLSKGRALVEGLEQAMREGADRPRPVLRIERAYSAWRLEGVSLAHVSRTAHLAQRAHEAIRTTSRAALETAYVDCARILHMGLPSTFRKRVALETVIDAVRAMRREADSWVAVVEATTHIVGWATNARAHAAEAIRLPSKSIRPPRRRPEIKQLVAFSTSDPLTVEGAVFRAVHFVGNRARRVPMRVASVSQPRRRSLTNVHLFERQLAQIEREVAAQNRQWAETEWVPSSRPRRRRDSGAHRCLRRARACRSPLRRRTSHVPLARVVPRANRPFSLETNMSINGVTNNPNIGLPTNDLGTQAPAYKSMSPEQIISFVQNTYANIDGQLADYQNDALAKNALANQLRDYKKLVREYPGKTRATFPRVTTRFDGEIARREEEFKAFDRCTDPS